MDRAKGESTVFSLNWVISIDCFFFADWKINIANKIKKKRWKKIFIAPNTFEAATTWVDLASNFMHDLFHFTRIWLKSPTNLISRIQRFGSSMQVNEAFQRIAPLQWLKINDNLYFQVIWTVFHSK